MDNKITLLCMTEKGYRVLQAIFDSSPDTIECVVSARDSAVERDYYDEIKAFCDQHHLDFRDRADCTTIDSTFSLAISWRWIIDTSSTTLIVLHDSLLPKYRGFAPLVSALINGEKEIGVTALLASDEYDCGEIIDQSSRQISYPIKIQDAIELLITNYIELATSLSRKITDGSALTTIKQNENKATYSLWRDDEDYKIDWSMSAEQIQRFVNAVGTPYKGALSVVNGKTARIINVSVIDDVRIENRSQGKVIFIQNGMPVIVCGSGLLRIDEIIDDETHKSLLPLSSFRTRFK